MRAGLVLPIAALAGASAVGLLARCSDDGQRDGDAAPDSWVPPKRDSGRDVEENIGDAGPDTCGLASDWPGYRRLLEFDSCNRVDVLVDQDAGYTMAWTDCDAAPGCKQLANFSQANIYAYATHDDAGSGGALHVSNFEISPVKQVDIFDLKTSSRLGEWRFDVDAVDVDVLLANADDSTTAFLGWRSMMLGAFAPAATLANTNPMPLKPYKAPGQDINEAISEKVFALQPFKNGLFTICEVQSGTCVPINLASISPAVPYFAFAWNDVVFAIAEHGTTGWAQEYVIHADGSITLLRSKANAHIWGMTTDGMTLVWEETYGTTNFSDPQTTTEVWKAPFTTDKATLDMTATKVTTLPATGLGGVGIAELDFFNGLYATSLINGAGNQPAAIYVVDVNTGQVQSVPKGPGGTMLGLPDVDRKELWEVTRTINSKSYLVRIPFSQPWN
jgi:hypothetical protein